MRDFGQVYGDRSGQTLPQDQDEAGRGEVVVAPLQLAGQVAHSRDSIDLDQLPTRGPDHFCNGDV